MLTSPGWGPGWRVAAAESAARPAGAPGLAGGRRGVCRSPGWGPRDRPMGRRGRWPLLARAQHFVQFGEQAYLVKRLFDEVHPAFQNTLGAEQALGIAGHEEHLDAGPGGAD